MWGRGPHCPDLPTLRDFLGLWTLSAKIGKVLDRSQEMVTYAKGVTVQDQGPLDGTGDQCIFESSHKCLEPGLPPTKYPLLPPSALNAGSLRLLVICLDHATRAYHALRGHTYTIRNVLLRTWFFKRHLFLHLLLVIMIFIIHLPYKDHLLHSRLSSKHFPCINSLNPPPGMLSCYWFYTHAVEVENEAQKGKMTWLRSYG